MPLHTLVWFLYGLAVLTLTSSEACLQEYTLNLEYLDFTPIDVPSAQKDDVIQSTCATWCFRLYADDCEAVFYQTVNRSCRVYRTSASRSCLTLHDLPDSRAFVLVQTRPQPITVCFPWPISEGIHPLVISREYPPPIGYYDSTGWLVIQRRINLTENFNRTWVEYEDGFGDLNHEFWLGNRHIHLLTNERRYEIRFDVEAENGSTGSRSYANFSLSASADNYALRISGPTSGTIGDELSGDDGVPFSTWDRDHDIHSSANCALGFGGGWWYRNCARAALNSMVTETSEVNRWQSLSMRIMSSVIAIRPAS